MNVTLPKELEEFVQSKVAVGGYPDASAVVAEALREFRSMTQDEPELERLPSPPDGACPPELKAILLEAVRGPHHPLPFDYFDQLRHHLRAKPGA
jgi:putative addiction module CopG family antidote